MQQKKSWIGEMQKHIKHFQKRVAICSCVIYCDCHLHSSIAILLVQNHYNLTFQLPGGRRDMIGQGRAEYKPQDESCLSTLFCEFEEEVGEKLQQFTSTAIPYFHTKSYKGQIVRVYYQNINCQELPDKTYGRLRLYEIVQRKWIPLKNIVQVLQKQPNKLIPLKIHYGIKNSIQQFCQIIQQKQLLK